MKINSWLYWISTMIALWLTHFTAHAAVNGPDKVYGRVFLISWTNTGHSGCVDAFRIKEYKNNKYTRTLTLYRSYPKTYQFTNMSAGEYRYSVWYGQCSSTGHSHLSAGSHTVRVYNSNNDNRDDNRDITFVHTNLLGTPIIETDVNGDIH